MEASQRLVASEQLQALVQPGRDARAGCGDANRPVHDPRLLPQLVAEPLERGLDRSRRPGIGRRQDSLGALEDRTVQERRVRLDVVEEEPREARELLEQADLL